MTSDATTDRGLHHVIGRDGRFVLSSPDGDVRIRGIDGDTVHVRSTHDLDLGHLVVERDDRRLVLDAGRGSGRGGGHPRTGDMVIEVPASAEVVIEGDSVDVDVERLTGVQRFRTGSGDLRLHDVRGAVSAEVMSGDLDLVADGPIQLDVRIVSGDLAVQAGSITALRATTTSGDVRVDGRFDGAGPYAIETVSGDVAIAPAGPVRVDLRTVTGDISSDVPAKTGDGQGRRSVVVGSGGPTVDVRSTSGDVRIVAARAHAPAMLAAPQTPTSAPVAAAPAIDDDRGLDVLRALERGEIEIDEARRRLEALDHD
jgi:Putative adhesin